MYGVAPRYDLILVHDVYVRDAGGPSGQAGIQRPASRVSGVDYIFCRDVVGEPFDRGEVVLIHRDVFVVGKPVTPYREQR